MGEVVLSGDNPKKRIIRVIKFSKSERLKTLSSESIGAKCWCFLKRLSNGAPMACAALSLDSKEGWRLTIML